MTRKRIVLATAAALAAVAGITITLIPHGTHHMPTTAPHPLAAPSPASPASPLVPALDLSGIRWVTADGYSVPVSAEAGPRDTASGLASGFTDDPLGALVGIVNIAVRTAWEFGPQVFQPTIQDQVTGPYEPQMLSSDLDSYDSSASELPDIQAYARIVAYQWVGYTPADATVDLVAAGPGEDGSTVYAATQIEAQWLNGDWRVVAPPGGDWGNSSVQVDSVNGYLTFPGQEG
jgi:hypothetical protein